MICKICSKEKVVSIFSRSTHSILRDLEYLEGICFGCYGSVPSHIPLEQLRKFLEGKLNGNEKVGSV